jgi:predicted GNAT family acetyltransferase
MYTEEVGVSPEHGGGADLYRARVMQLVNRGWSFARFDDQGRLVFKAEVACATPYAAQIQGVFVPADRRGLGLATAGMAAVVQLVRREIAPVVSLYVNDWNTSARAVYERVGFHETARFATVMF